jgi:PAS domain S-box-containing protein
VGISRSDPALSPQEVAVILDSVADGVFTVDEVFRITSFNHAAEEITGVPRREAIGRPCCEVFRASICEAQCALKETMCTGRSVINRPVYILRPEGDRVPISISTAILKDRRGQILGGVETFRDLRLVEQLRAEIARQYTFGDILSKNGEMQRIFAMLPAVAESDSTVLVEGESGTGKELVARAMHSLSPRREKPLVTVNCGALPDTLLESELFGYKAGAFTDARKDKPGRFALAEGGTIFLDEIGDVSPRFRFACSGCWSRKPTSPSAALNL